MLAQPYYWRIFDNININNRHCTARKTVVPNILLWQLFLTIKVRYRD